MVELWLFVITMMFVGGVVLRIWRRRLEPIWLQRVSVPAAQAMVGEFVESCYEGLFGFPTGLFVVEVVEPDRLVARELTSRGSHFLAILGGFYRAVLRFFVFLGPFGLLVGLAMAFMLTPFLLYAAATEVALRHLLRSEIVAEFGVAPEGTSVGFTLRGPAALLVGRRLLAAFHQSALPQRVALVAGLATPPAGA